jgi:hypothetical protein
MEPGEDEKPTLQESIDSLKGRDREAYEGWIQKLSGWPDELEGNRLKKAALLRVKQAEEYTREPYLKSERLSRKGLGKK